MARSADKGHERPQAVIGKGKQHGAMDDNLTTLLLAVANIIGAVLVAWITKGAARQGRKRTPPQADRLSAP